MYNLGDFVPLTSLAIVLDIVILLSAFTLGLFGYIRQIGGWLFFGIIVLISWGIHLMPENESPIIILVIAGVTLGISLGFCMFEPRVSYKRSTGTRGSRFTHSYAGPSGFEDVESDLNEQSNEPSDNEESHHVSQVHTESKDYYGVLGVARTADLSHIKLAYRALMKNCHPDFFPGDKGKEARAKELNEAFDVLGDDQKRAAFDRFGFVS